VSEQKAILVIGAGDATGGEAHGFGSDARKEEEMVSLVERIERRIPMPRPKCWPGAD
jgi:hypothetical protein